MPKRRRQPRWLEATDEELLELRLCDLDLEIGSGPLGDCIERLHDELEEAGIAFRPDIWLSSDWFSPDGVPGFALPFFLAHPRLVRLERRMCLFAEGAPRAWCMRLLRHEAGHAIDTAYGLHRRPEWRAAFGARSTRYARSYHADPKSREHVRNLPRWYAQSHPAEDFAETFAVWLGSRTLRSYAGWPARRKLELVGRLVEEEVVGRRPLLALVERTESIDADETPLRTYYARKRRRWERAAPAPWSKPFARMFQSHRPWNARSSAARHLRGVRARLLRMALRRTGFDRYSIEQALEGMIHDAAERGHEIRSAPPTLSALTVLVDRYLKSLQSKELRLSR
jgi:hypothetical protein